MERASLVFGGDNPVEKFTNLPFNSEGDLFDTAENRVITSGWLKPAFGPSNSVIIESVRP
jgi:hypothetical protein